MYSSIKDFVDDRKSENASTIKILSTINTNSLSYKVYGEGRELGRIAWHIVQTITEMGAKAGLFVTDPLEDQPVPASSEEILSQFEKYSTEVVLLVQKKWSDEDLSQTVNMYGEFWTKTQILEVLTRHEIHHRGQLTVLMRQAGLKVPGIYGPSKEEWVAYGMAAHE